MGPAAVRIMQAACRVPSTSSPAGEGLPARRGEEHRATVRLSSGHLRTGTRFGFSIFI